MPGFRPLRDKSRLGGRRCIDSASDAGHISLMGRSSHGRAKRPRIPCPRCGAPLEWRQVDAIKDETTFGACKACGRKNEVVFYENLGKPRFKITDLGKKLR